MQSPLSQPGVAVGFDFWNIIFTGVPPISTILNFTPFIASLLATSLSYLASLPPGVAGTKMGATKPPFVDQLFLLFFFLIALSSTWIPLAPMGVLAPRLRTLDGPLVPPSTRAEIFRRTCLGVGWGDFQNLFLINFLPKSGNSKHFSFFSFFSKKKLIVVTIFACHLRK